MHLAAMLLDRSKECEASLCETRAAAQGLLASLKAFRMDAVPHIRQAENMQLQLQVARTQTEIPRTLTTYDHSASTPGSPWQNGFGGSFNDRLRDECLNVEWFKNLREAKVIVETWRGHYNRECPHSSLEYRTPSEFYAAYKQKEMDLTTVRI